MVIRWSPEAANDLEQIGLYIAENNRQATTEVVRTIYAGVTALSSFPNRGRPGRVPGTRELVFPTLPYIAVYRVVERVVEISRVRHGSQHWS